MDVAVVGQDLRASGTVLGVPWEVTLLPAANGGRLTVDATGADVAGLAVDVGALVHEVALGFDRQLADRRLDLQITVADLLPPALGNADRLAQVIANLLGNATKFSPDGERIDVSVRRETVHAGDPMAPPIPAGDPRAWIPTPAGGNSWSTTSAWSPRSGPPSASASRRSSTPAEPGRCCASGPRRPTASCRSGSA